MPLKETLKNKQGIKRLILWMVSSPVNPRPRWWIRWMVTPLIHKRGRGSIIRHYTRLDLFPWNRFSLGKRSTIEDFATINNGVGDVVIGDDCTIGIGNTVIGPVTIGNHVIMAQNVVLSGLNHGYEDTGRPIREQPITKSPITIRDEVWIGANVTVVAGITVGKHAVVAAGSVVTRDVPPFSVVGGNPARLIKRYDETKGAWERVKAE